MSEERDKLIYILPNLFTAASIFFGVISIISTLNGNFTKAIIFIFFVSLLMYLVDNQINDFATALWYVIVSITATGYGDVVPGTLMGRVIGIIAMIGGVLIFAAITAVISSIYVSKISKASHTDLESRIDDLTLEVKELNKKIDELKKEKD